MNDEINSEITEKIVSLSFQAARFSGSALRAAMNKYSEHRQRHRYNKEISVHGKMKVSELVGEGSAASTIDISNGTIRTFEKTAAKYGVDFAVKKDKSCEPPKYTVIFKAKDKELIARAFVEYTQKNEKKQARKPMHQRLEEKQRIIENRKEHENEKTRDRKKVREKNRNRERDI